MEENEQENIREGTGGNEPPDHQQHGPDQQQYIWKNIQQKRQETMEPTTINSK